MPISEMEVYPQTTAAATPQPNNAKPVDSYSLLWKKATQDKNRTPLHELINFDWSKDDQSVGKFIEFIINLVTFNQSYAIDAFTLLSTAFEPYKQALATGTKVDYSKWEKISMRVHFSLNKIVSVLPLSAPSLADILVHKFPHTIHPLEVHHFFLKHILLVTRYCSSISAKIVSAAVNSLVLIDTSISVEETQGDDELQFDDIDGVKSPSNDQEKNAMNAQKLDGLMVLMFQYLDARFNCGRLEGNMFVIGDTKEDDVLKMDDLFHSLVKAFDASVLPTYKSKYIQFLLIYASRLTQVSPTFAHLDFNTALLSHHPKPPSPAKPSPGRFAAGARVQYAESFVRYLCGKLANESIPSILRQACASYIGGFISRAKYLPSHVVKLVFKELVLFAVSYVDRYDTKASECTPNPQLHSIFYAVCQSLYYIFCFRNNVLLNFSQDYPDGNRPEKQRELWQDLNEAFQKISYSRLNPFKICSKNVVKQFCSVCLRVNIFSKCTAILQANKKIVKSKTSSFSTNYQQSNQFDSFFPFDPYLLAQSSKYIDECYLHWSDVKKDEDDIDLEEMSDGEEEEDDDDDKKNDDTDSEFDDFDEDEDESSSSSDDEDESFNSELDQLTEDFKSFTPTGMPDAAHLHFKNRGL